jgi:alpha-1,2-mannosyltransferase
MVLLTLLAFGWPIWREYLGGGRQGGMAVLGAPFVPGLAEGGGVSVFWMLRSLHFGDGLAFGGQAASSAVAMLLTCWIWRRPEVPRLDAVALTVFLSLLATPYGYVDDMVAYSIMLLVLAERRGWRIGMFDALFFMWPALCAIVSQKTGVLLTPVIVLLAAARTWKRAGLPMPHLPMRAAVLPRAG